MGIYFFTLDVSAELEIHCLPIRSVCRPLCGVSTGAVLLHLRLHARSFCKLILGTEFGW